MIFKTNNFHKLSLVFLLLLSGCSKDSLTKDETWVFIMAGQSNMAGRAEIEPQDTLSNSRILAIDAFNKVKIAKEPIHFYEPNRAGLGCGLSFGKTITSQTPNNIKILLVPTAIGASKIEQWINDERHRDVKLLSNFKDKVSLASTLGKIKGIIWHQGESDANSINSSNYKENLKSLMTKFRQIVNNKSLPIVIGELGSYSNNSYWSIINNEIHEYSQEDIFTSVINTSDLLDKGDNVHFNSESQRKIGVRFAEKLLVTLEYFK